MKNLLLINLFADMLFHFGIALLCAPVMVMLYLQEYCHVSPYEISSQFDEITSYSMLGFSFAVFGILMKKRKLLTLKTQKHE